MTKYKFVTRVQIESICRYINYAQMIKVGLHKDRKHWEKGENAVKTTFSPFSYNVFKSPVLLGGLGGGH